MLKAKIVDNAKIIKSAWWLSVAGLAPFVLATVEIWFDVRLLQVIFGAPAMVIFFTYGAVILSFLGGIMWSDAINMRGNSQLATWFLCFSVVPSLIAWLALLVQPDNFAWVLLFGGFASLLKIEHVMLQLGLRRVWFWHLRRNISIVVMLLILLNCLH